MQNNPQKNQLRVKLQTPDINAIGFALNRIKEMFDLSLDPIYVSPVLQTQAMIKKHCTQGHGVRLVRCWDRFELAICTILGQLISIKQATHLTETLMENYGERRKHPFSHNEIRLFPTAEILANETLTAVKIPQIKKEAIKILAQQVLSGAINFSSYQDPRAFKEKLMRIRGIGKWTAEYIALRAIGDSDACPEGDVYLNKLMDINAIKALSPWRGYLASYLYKYGAET